MLSLGNVGIVSGNIGKSAVPGIETADECRTHYGGDRAVAMASASQCDIAALVQGE